MNTPQILVLSILGVLTLAAFAVICTSKKEGVNILSAFILLVIVSVLMMAVVSLTIQANELREVVSKKCPEYEKIENVYKLKQ